MKDLSSRLRAGSSTRARLNTSSLDLTFFFVCFFGKLVQPEVWEVPVCGLSTSFHGPMKVAHSEYHTGLDLDKLK
jgi:hypothetical protein